MEISRQPKVSATNSNLFLLSLKPDQERISRIAKLIQSTNTVSLPQPGYIYQHRLDLIGQLEVNVNELERIKSQEQYLNQLQEFSSLINDLLTIPEGLNHNFITSVIEYFEAFDSKHNRNILEAYKKIFNALKYLYDRFERLQDPMLNRTVLERHIDQVASVIMQKIKQQYIKKEVDFDKEVNKASIESIFNNSSKFTDNGFDLLRERDNLDKIYIGFERLVNTITRKRRGLKQLEKTNSCPICWDNLSRFNTRIQMKKRLMPFYPLMTES
jgi:DNA integrity scanning protein DisA with diadenylate cyclase activity